MGNRWEFMEQSMQDAKNKPSQETQDLVRAADSVSVDSEQIEDRLLSDDISRSEEHSLANQLVHNERLMRDPRFKRFLGITAASLALIGGAPKAVEVASYVRDVAAEAVGDVYESSIAEQGDAIIEQVNQGVLEFVTINNPNGEAGYDQLLAELGEQEGVDVFDADVARYINDGYPQQGRPYHYGIKIAEGESNE